MSSLHQIKWVQEEWRRINLVLSSCAANGFGVICSKWPTEWNKQCCLTERCKIQNNPNHNFPAQDTELKHILSSSLLRQNISWRTKSNPTQTKVLWKPSDPFTDKLFALRKQKWRTRDKRGKKKKKKPNLQLYYCTLYFVPHWEFKTPGILWG